MNPPPKPTKPLGLAVLPQTPQAKEGKTFGATCSPDVLESYRTTLRPSEFERVTSALAPEGVPPDEALHRFISERRASLELKRMFWQPKLQAWNQRDAAPVTSTTDGDESLSKEYKPGILDFLRAILHPETVEEILKLKATSPEKAPSQQELMGEMINMLAKPPSSKDPSKQQT